MVSHLGVNSENGNLGEQVLHAENEVVVVEEDVSEKLEVSKSELDDEAGLDSKYSYLVMFGAFVNILAVFGCSNAFGIFQEYYLNTLFSDKPASDIAWISTISISVSLAGGIMASPIMHRIGIRLTFVLGSLSASLGLILASFSTGSIAALTITQGLIFGFGSSLIINCSIFMPSLWFKKYRSWAIGIVSAGSGFGGLKYRSWAIGIVSAGSGFGGLVVGPILENAIRNLGIKWAFRILCFMTLAITLTTSIIFKPRQPGFKPANKRLLNMKVFLHPYTLFLCFGGFFAELGYAVLSLYFTASMVAIGQSRSTASNTILAFSAASGISRLLSGYFSNRFGPNTVLIFAMSATSVLVFSMWLPFKNFVVYYVFFVLTGLLCSLFFPLGPVMIANNYPLGEVSQVNGIMYVFYGLSTLIGNPSLGAMFDKIGHRESYSSLIITCGVCFIASAMILLLQLIYSRKYMPDLKTGRI
ncbi:Riboflavin transporter MCH5 [Smittium mucronatum]|uniref:Riboflavin transporter MCH5 n=1 Tax=Smittium mucronatum TaxID=133383 RepID=A0A1R0H1D8_9FUNG|nr:Riboflavin transporter MCH5 [Smittium mucronatum]